MYAGDKIASVFRASAGNGKAEKLGEVTLAALTTNNTYKVQVYTNLKNAVMIKKMICIAVCTWMCACCEKNDGGGNSMSR